ncbi:MAG TPA: undecaprenyl-diphosphate phosphatase, partial [Candidatus Angelobacter sp.]
MHEYLLSLFLGVVEGLTEFLPVSSTAHLRICEELIGHYSTWRFSPPLNLHDPFWKMYSIVIQLGAILCLPIYFRARIARFLSTFPRGERDDRTWLTHPLSLVMIAFVCTAVPSLLLTKLIGEHLESFTVFGVSLLVGGVIMWIVDAYFGSPRTVGRHMTERMEDVSLFQAIWIGICQVASAVFPGTS